MRDTRRERERGNVREKVTEIEKEKERENLREAGCEGMMMVLEELDWLRRRRWLEDASTDGGEVHGGTGLWCRPEEVTTMVSEEFATVASGQQRLLTKVEESPVLVGVAG